MKNRKSKQAGSVINSKGWKASLDYRPQSYWKIDDPLSAILANVSGQARRQMIKDYWDRGKLEELNDELLKDDLTDNVRRDLGRIHPFFMGGEYLPGRLPDEVTIVRINLQSVTFDVVELRARRVSNGKIRLRWVDEYNEKFIYPFKEINRPFSFGELIDFIEQTTLEGWCWGNFPLAYNEFNKEGHDDPEELRNFSSFSSEFYPQLSAWFGDVVDEWIENNKKVDEEEDDE